MFKEARIKLTLWYLAIIMAVSFSFSFVIYRGVNRELKRIDSAQKNWIAQRMPPPRIIDADLVSESRERIILTLGFINASIFVFSAISGYFLAGITLEPISEMVENQKKFVSNASHELRTPLTALKSEIEVSLRDKDMTLTEAKNIIASNLEEVEKMHKLSDYLLKLNKYEKGQIDMTKVDLKVVAKSVANGVSSIASKKNIKILTDFKSSKVNGNRDSLKEMMTILLENAVKYSEKGKKVWFKVKDGVIEIADEGVGIAESDMPHIFERFFRSDKSRTKDGYGLGLSIAKEIVDVHGGEIKVKSVLNKGTTFNVILNKQ